jgi:hypothetical protein
MISCAWAQVITRAAAGRSVGAVRLRADTSRGFGGTGAAAGRIGRRLALLFGRQAAAGCRPRSASASSAATTSPSQRQRVCCAGPPPGRRRAAAGPPPGQLPLRACRPAGAGSGLHKGCGHSGPDPGRRRARMGGHHMLLERMVRAMQTCGHSTSQDATAVRMFSQFKYPPVTLLKADFICGSECCARSFTLTVGGPPAVPIIRLYIDRAASTTLWYVF